MRKKATVNHANRNRGNQRSRAGSPQVSEVIAARNAVGLTQTQAGAVIYGSLRAWQNFEADPSMPNHRPMYPGLFELFLLKTGQLSLEQLLDATAAEMQQVNERA